MRTQHDIEISEGTLRAIIGVIGLILMFLAGVLIGAAM